MIRLCFLLALLTLPIPGTAQSYDVLTGFHGETTFRYTRKGIPSTFMGTDTASRFTEFDGTLLIRGVENPSPDRSTIIHSLMIRKHGMESIRTSRRIVSEQMLDVVVLDTLVETVGDGEGAGRNSLRGWLFPDTVWNSPPCPGIPDTTIFYQYGHLYRNYTPSPADSLDERDDLLRLRTLQTDCLDNAWSSDFLLDRFSGLREMRFSSFNFLDWSSDERYILTVTPSVGSPELLPASIDMSCYPNPSAGDATIQITAQEAGSLRLLVHDLQGRVLHTLYDGWITPGDLDVRFDTRGLPGGRYYCTALTARAMRTIPVVVPRRE